MKASLHNHCETRPDMCLDNCSLDNGLT